MDANRIEEIFFEAADKRKDELLKRWGETRKIAPAHSDFAEQAERQLLLFQIHSMTSAARSAGKWLAVFSEALRNVEDAVKSGMRADDEVVAELREAYMEHALVVGLTDIIDREILDFFDGLGADPFGEIEFEERPEEEELGEDDEDEEESFFSGLAEFAGDAEEYEEDYTEQEVRDIEDYFNAAGGEAS